MDVNIKDVALKAGVSTATVSRIVNNKDTVAEATRQRVLQVIDDLGYQPNALARGLLNKQTNTIGMIFPKVSGLFSSTLLSGVEDATQAEGFSTIVCTTDGSVPRTLKYLQLLAERRVDGLLFATEILQDEYYAFIRKVGLPLVLVATSSPRHQVPSVRCDDRQLAYAATSYLIERGHHDVAVLCDRALDAAGRLSRVDGYRQALEAQGLPVREENIVLVDGFSFEAGRAAAAVLLDRPQRPSAVFASSDELAVGVISAAHRLGLRVPADLSVMGYDDLPFASMAIPPLSTVAQPLYEIGRTAVQLLLRQIHGGPPSESVVMPHRLIERESVLRL